MLKCHLMYVSGTRSVAPDTCDTAVITYHKNRRNMCWRTSKQGSARVGLQLHILCNVNQQNAQYL